LKVIELGATGPTPYYDLVKPSDGNWHTLNLSGNKASDGWSHHIETGNEYSFPIEDNSFDIVLSGQVIEHVKDIFQWMEELQRIIKPGGLVITVNPVSWPYHEAPVDCWRIFPDGMKALTDRAGLHLILSKVECLEPQHFGYPEQILEWPNFTVPGISIADDNFKIFSINPARFRVNRVLKYLPLIRAFMSPVKVAYDTITIAQKPK
jgi:SAM-dependent methyltransferase